MGCGFITEDSFGYEKFVVFESWKKGKKGKVIPLHAMEAHGGRGGTAPTKKVRAKCLVNFFVLGSYMLQ
jgi:hypothetical protein